MSLLSIRAAIVCGILGVTPPPTAEGEPDWPAGFPEVLAYPDHKISGSFRELAGRLQGQSVSNIGF